MSGLIGAAVHNIDGDAKARGETRFIADYAFPGQLYAYPVFSRIPHARLRTINADSARFAPGVVDVITAQDVPGENRVGVIVDDQPLFVHDRIRYTGDTVALVIADSAESAWNAAKQVEIDCEALPPVLSIEDSRASDAPLLHDTNIASQHQVLRGDVESAFASARHIVTGFLRTPYQEHLYLETQGCIAVPEGSNSITIYGSIQCVFYVQKAVARVLGLPYSRVRVVQMPLGGAFGGKEDIPSEVCARAAVAAWKLRKPVKMIYRRDDDILSTSKRHPAEMHYKIGIDDSGVLVAADIDIHLNSGAYATLSSVVSYRSCVQALGPYRINDIRVHSTAWYTNLPTTGAFRGFGSPQATFGHEVMMDRVARAIGMDPVEFRLRNIITNGDQTMTGHRVMASVGAKQTLESALQLSGFNTDNDEQRLDPSGRYLYGTGLAVCHYGNCLGAPGWFMDGAAARIQIHRDGAITVAYGLVDMGQGANTVVAQMTAAALGVDIARITVAQTDTINVPDSGPSVASRNVVMTGNAIRDAAETLTATLRKVAALRLNCETEDVLYQDGCATHSESDQQLSFRELAELLYLHNMPMEALGWWHVPELDFDHENGIGEAYFTYSYAAHIARVRVDTLTGRIRVEKFWAAHDVGRAINPAGLAGQVEGGVTQGIGWVLYENFRMKDGAPQTPDFSTCLLPTTIDSPEIESTFIEEPEELGPWGAKGIGEPAIIPVAAAVANAVANALDCDIDEIPITPETVLRLLAESEKLGEKR